MQIARKTAQGETEPQIKAPRVTPLEGVSTYAPQGIRVRGVENPQVFGIDERRFVVQDYPPSPTYKKPQYSDSKSPALDYGDKPRCSTLVTQIKRMFSYPCKSAPSAKSAFYRTGPRTKSIDGEVSGFIWVHPRVFYDVTFQTGLTGYTFNFKTFFRS